MKQKLKNRRGETLVEVLVAIMVIGASIALLTGMVNASMSINSQVREMDMGDKGFYDTLSTVETHAFSNSDTPITVKAVQQNPAPGEPVLSDIQFSDVCSYTSEGGNTLTVYGKKEG